MRFAGRSRAAAAPGRITLSAPADRGELLGTLAGIVGSAHVLTGDADREFFSQDVYGRGLAPLAIVQPADAAELSNVLQAVAPSRLPILARGGGMSYTGGYLSTEDSAVLIDLRRLDRILEINATDMYVTVECGVTWKSLRDSLAGHGLRTPYWGPLSGLRSTVGGALSQGSIFLGSTRYGTAGDSCIGLDVLSVDGRLLRLGSHAIANGPPFFRQHGPDLMGVFLSDTGALGIKTRMTLRAIPLAQASEHLSFAYATAADMFEAMAIVARLEAASECFAFDSTLQGMITTSAGLGADLKLLGNALKGAGFIKGLGNAARIAIAGRRFLKDVNYSLHVSLDADSADEVRSQAMRIAKALAGRGRRLDASIPRMIRMEPFAEVTGMLGPSGERWVNVHGIVAFSRAAAMLGACQDVFLRHSALLDEYHIATGYLMCGVGMAGILIEPVIYWPDAREAFHNRVLPDAHLATLTTYPPNSKAREAVGLIRRDLANAFLERGAVSFQLGKFYDYRRALDAGAFDLLQMIKQSLDPFGRMNSGNLGFRMDDRRPDADAE